MENGGSQGKITLKDIAKELKISKGTVDRAIHNRPDVSPVTRQKVLQLIQKYDYKADKAARSLSLRSKRVRIGVICQGEVQFFWDNVKNGIASAEAELSDFGLEIVVREVNDRRDTKAIINYLDEFVSMSVDGIALVPVNSPAIKERIDELVEAGIPIVTLNDDISDSKRLFYVGPQIRQSGRIAGELMGRFLHGRGKVFTISLELASLEYKERLEGFKEVMRENFKDIDIVGNFSYGYMSVTENEIRMLRNILENIGEVDGIYDITGGCLYDVATAVHGIEKLKDAVLIGHEIWSKVRDLISEGVITACISQDPYSQGYFVIKMLFSYLTDGKLPEFNRMYARLDVVMKENLISQNNIINPYYIHTK